MIKLIRTASSPIGTYGTLVRDSVPICLTLEDPWNENKRQISCIPEGMYHCIPHNGTKYKNVWELLGVSGRSAILIHNGNTTDDTMGCILVGKSYGQVNGKYGVLQSNITLGYLRSALPATFDLVIVNAWG